MCDFGKETRQNPIYPDGTYKVRINHFERVTASTGTPQIRWRANIVSPEEHAGRSIIIHTYLTDKSLWKIANLIFGCGVDVTKLKVDTSSPVYDRICQACVGRLTYWRNVQSTTPSGDPKNEIVQFSRDETQDVITLTGEEDVPDFLKKEWKEEEL